MKQKFTILLSLLSLLTISKPTKLIAQCTEPPVSAYLASSLSGGTTVVNQAILFESDFVVDVDLIFDNCTLYFDPGVSITVQNNSILTIENNSYLTVCDPTLDMWEGLRVDGPGNMIILNDSKIEHAVYGINSSLGGSYDVHNSRFSGNYIGVYAHDYTGTLNGTIEGTIFEQVLDASTGLPLDLLTNPIGALNGHSGVYVQNIGHATIGSDLSAVNYFTNVAKSGVHCDYSDVVVENSVFKIGDMQTGVYSLGSGAFGELLTVKGCYMTPAGVDSYYGIFSNGHPSMIENNDIIGITNGIRCTDMGASFIFDNKISDAEVGISIDQVLPASTLNAVIFDNELTSCRKGIRGTNIPSNSNGSDMFVINNNSIQNTNSSFASSSISEYGIQVNNCDVASVVNNFISLNRSTSSILNDDKRAIQISECSGSIVSENEIHTAGSGIWVSGLCNDTRFTCNAMRNTNFGFNFLPTFGTAATEISTQGYIDTDGVYIPNDNIWIDGFVGDFRTYGGPLNTPIDWYSREALLSPNVYNVFGPLGPGVSNINYIPFTGITEVTSCSGNNGIGTFWAVPRGLLDPIVKDEIIREVLSNEFDTKSKDYVYKNLLERPDLFDLGTSDDIVYESFFELMQNSNIGYFRDVLSKIDARNYEEALVQNASIWAEDLMEENQKVVTLLYLDKFRKHIEFSATEVETLENIATLTPYLGGDAVYSARIMLDLWPEETGVAYRTDGSIQGEQIDYELMDRFKVYPNPAKDYITVSFIEIKDLEGVIFYIYNMMGVEVRHEVLDFNFNRLDMDISSLNSGIYFYTLERNGEIILKNQLVKID